MKRIGISGIKTVDMEGSVQEMKKKQFHDHLRMGRDRTPDYNIPDSSSVCKEVDRNIHIMKL